MTTTLREPVSTAPISPSPQTGYTWEAEDPALSGGGGGLTERRVMADGNGYCGPALHSWRLVRRPSFGVVAWPAGAWVALRGMEAGVSLAKRIARHVLRDELDALRWQTVIDSDANAAALLEAVARVMRMESKGVVIRSADNLSDWEAFRR